MIQVEINQYPKLKQDPRTLRVAEMHKHLSLMMAPPRDGQLQPNLPSYHPEGDSVDSTSNSRYVENLFLFTDMQSRNMEMRLRILSLRAQTAIQSGKYEKGLQLCIEAEAVDQKLPVSCLRGKVCFWKGFTSLKLGQPDRALQYFEDAKAAKGHYREDEHAKVWADFTRSHSKSPNWRISRIDLLENLGVGRTRCSRPGVRLGD